jgi:hypothetical protein
MVENNSLIKENKFCPITNSDKFVTYLDLGHMPLVNNLSDTKKDSLICEKYPLSVQYCLDSELSMLTHTINPKLLYSNYYYMSGISQPYISHCKNMFYDINKIIEIKDNMNILDIGGNDGTLLESFLSINPKLNVLNVDASENLINYCKSIKNIPAINAFWDINVAKQINKKFDLITSTNVFQHTEYCNEFTEAISFCLSKNGIWCLEFPSWENSVLTNQFDQIYHEHLYYYNVPPLQLLFKKYGLKIVSKKFLNIHGGTLRLLITKDEHSLQEISMNKTLTMNDYINWGNSVETHISNSKKYILNLKNKGYKIAGFGAAAKGCVFLNAAKIDNTILEYVIDDTDIKQGKYIPGTGIKIVGREVLKKEPVDYILILAHNFTDYISRSLTSYKGKIIVFFPEIKTI